MKLYFKPEWRIPTAVGVTSFVAGTVTGVLGLKLKQRRDDEKLIGELKEVVIPIDINQMKLDFQKAAEEGPEFKREIISSTFPDGEGQAGHMHKIDWATGPVGTIERVEKENGEYEDVFIPKEESDFQWPEHLPEPEDVVYPEPEPVVLPEDHPIVQERTAPRPTDRPYAIPQDEYFANETGYKQNTLEYFAVDNLVCDEDQVLVYNFAEILGDMEFGHLSGDENIVYIRNPKLKGEYEVVRREDESYQEVAMGLRMEEEQEQAIIESELRHSNRVPKFRD